MMFRGTLIRLAGLYLVLLALILACLDVIVYFSLSDALHARVSTDLRDKARHALGDLDITRGTVNTPQTYQDPTYADTFVFVVQTRGEQDVLVKNAPQIQGLSTLPNQAPIKQAKQGQTTEGDVTVEGQQFQVRTEPIRDRAGQLVGVLQVAKPIAQVQETLDNLERQLLIASAVAMLMGAIVAIIMANRSLHPIRAAFQKQREFVADASHELRTPLTLIRANAEAWERRAPPGSDHAYARHILEEVDQLNHIVGDLTTLALADARQLKMDLRSVELSGVVRELIDHTAPLADERKVSVAPNLNGKVTIEGDPTRVRQLFLILIDNALRYTPAGGHVEVGVGRDHGRARITVTDSGPGIAPEHIPHLFERFYRVDRARSRESGGIGLGLAIAKWIVDVHHGHIQIESAAGQGTRVMVSLPAIEP